MFDLEWLKSLFRRFTSQPAEDLETPELEEVSQVLVVGLDDLNDSIRNYSDRT